MPNNDPFIGVMTTLIGNFSIANSLGWTVIAQNSPNRKEWNNPPLCIVTPAPKHDVKYLAGGQPRTISAYDVFLLDTQNLASNFDNSGQYLFDCCMRNFMPANTAILAAGAYMSRVVPKYDFDRTVFPKGWSSSCVTVEVYYMNP
jgi:hypothetical protein